MAIAAVLAMDVECKNASPLDSVGRNVANYVLQNLMRPRRDKTLNSMKSNTLAAAMRKNTRVLILLLVEVTLGALVVVGQEGAPVTKKDAPVTDRFENAIKAKEPTFTLKGKLLRNNNEEKYALLGWKSGEDFVSTSTYELASPEEAAEVLRKTLEAPMSVPLETIKLTQLGDEAYMSRWNQGKQDHVNLLLRKGKYFILMSASSQGLAQRFAKHLAGEIDN